MIEFNMNKHKQKRTGIALPSCFVAIELTKQIEDFCSDAISNGGFAELSVKKQNKNKHE